ncbi:MAG: aminoglycoside phosphotransferase family protein [Cyanobacteria bacterium J06635_1]
MTLAAHTIASVDALQSIAQRFMRQGRIGQIHPLGNGNINDTYLVTLDDATPQPWDPHFVLQQLNTAVFQQPAAVMGNLRMVSEHVRQRLVHSPPSRRWEVPCVLQTQSGQDHWLEPGGNFWRAISFIPNAITLETLETESQAWEVGYGLGMFHTLVSDLPPQQLADTLPGFHITPRYLDQYSAVLAHATLPEAPESDAPEIRYCLDFIRDRTPWAGVLERAKQSGHLPLRLMHGDPKVNNVLFDTVTQQAISLIDLDTIKPGLVHYDIGDCIRSGCNSLGEETAQWEQVQFQTDLCNAVLQGYSSIAQAFLTPSDYDYLYDAIRLLPFELGLRFFTDYLAGDIYFKTRYPKHNLIRSLVQFKLTESIEAQAVAIKAIIQDLQ